MTEFIISSLMGQAKGRDTCVSIHLYSWEVLYGYFWTVIIVVVTLGYEGFFLFEN